MLEPDSAPRVSHEGQNEKGVDMSQSELRIGHEFAARLGGVVDAVDLEGAPQLGPEADRGEEEEQQV